MIGLALYEEQDDLDQGSEYKFKFLYKAIIHCKSLTTKTSNLTDLFSIKSFKTGETNDLNLIKLLDDLISIENLTDQYKLLASYLNDYAKKLLKLKNKLSEQSAKSSKQLARASSAEESIEDVLITDDTNDEAQQKEKRKNLIAERRRAKIMAQLNLQQKSFIQKNQEFYDETKAISSSVGSSSDFNFFNKMEIVTNEVVAIGPYHCALAEQTKKTYHCILCQEDEDISVNAPPMVLCTYVQSSKVLSKNRNKSLDKLETFDQLFMDASLYWGIHTTSCGHVMHAVCWQKYVDTVKIAENRRHSRYYGFNVNKNEYLS